MSNLIFRHLDNITDAKLADFKNSLDSFSLYASAAGKNDIVKIGVIGSGEYVVWDGAEPFTFDYCYDAVEKYKELLRS